MKVLFAGGGTGGHIYPALAIAGELLEKKPDTEIMFIAGTRGIERNILEESGYTMESIPVTGFPRKLSPGLVPFACKLGISCVKSRHIIKRFRPSVVFATGGYVSAPPIIAAHFFGTPVALQEQNSYPGITSRKLARYADIVFLGFSEAERYFTGKTETVASGNPVRKEIGTGERMSSAARFGLDPSRKTVFLFGGSQGSRALNEAMSGAAEQIAAQGIQILWQTGRNNFETYASFDRSVDGLIRVFPYIDDMVSAYAVADCAVARAGAMTLAEINACSLPAVFVPLPTAAENHQEKNARALVNEGAASMILERDLTPGVFTREILGIMENEERLRSMAEASRRLGKKDAASVIAGIVIERYAEN